MAGMRKRAKRAGTRDGISEGLLGYTGYRVQRSGNWLGRGRLRGGHGLDGLSASESSVLRRVGCQRGIRGRGGWWVAWPRLAGTFLSRALMGSTMKK